MFEEAYRTSRYIVHTAGRESFTLLIGRENPEFGEFLREGKFQSCSIITAYNPRSLKQHSKENTEANRRLAAEIEKEGLSFFPSEAHSADGSWDIEYGFCVMDIAPGKALRLAEKFSQNAIVYYEDGKAPALLFTDIST